MSNSCDGEHIAIRGQWGTVEWAVVHPSTVPQAKKFYLSLDEGYQVKVLGAFKLWAEYGRINNRELFRQLGDQAGKKARGLWEFKRHQVRFIGDTRPGKRFIVAWGTRKKQDDLNDSDIDSALKVLMEFDALNVKMSR